MNKTDIFQLHRERMINYTMSYSRQGRDFAEDIVSDVYLRYMKADVNIEKPVAWLYTSIRNRLVDWKRSGIDKEEQYGFEEEHYKVDFDYDATHLFIALEELQRLYPDECRMFFMRYIMGISEDECAEILGVPINTFKAQHHRAKVKVREKLRRLLSAK